jgi:hypothetical protein
VISLATIGALERMEKTKREECTVLWLGDTVWWDLLIESNFAKREKKVKTRENENTVLFKRNFILNQTLYSLHF